MSSVPPSPAEREQDRSVGELLSGLIGDLPA